MSGKHESLEKMVTETEEQLARFGMYRRSECERLSNNMIDFLKQIQDSAELEVIEAIQEWADTLENLGHILPDERRGQ